MISQVTGKIKKRKPLSIVVDVNGISYEVLIPPAVMKGIEKATAGDDAISLITYHYYQMDPSKAIPVLVGFLNEIEKEFFELFITVSGVGPKAALAVLDVLSPAELAAASARDDKAAVARAQGVGPKLAQRIVLELKGKPITEGPVAAFHATAAQPAPEKPSASGEAVAALMGLGVAEPAARRVVEQGGNVATAYAQVVQLPRAHLRQLGAALPQALVRHRPTRLGLQPLCESARQGGEREDEGLVQHGGTPEVEVPDGAVDRGIVEVEFSDQNYQDF